MAKKTTIKTLEESICRLQKQEAKEISIKELLSVLSGRGRPLILLLLSLPFCQPIPLPGLSTVFGIAIAFIGLRTSFGKRIWLPKKLLFKKIKMSTLKKITDVLFSVIQKIKRWIHPRLCWACRTPFMQSMSGVLIFMLGAFLALPLPIPFSNLLAAWSIFLIAIGILEDDGLCVLIGYFLALLTVIFFVGIVVATENLI